MLLSAGVKKIVICTPSNMSNNFILNELTKKSNLLSQAAQDVKIVRAAPHGYLPPGNLVKYTIQYKVQEEAGYNRKYELED